MPCRSTPRRPGTRAATWSSPSPACRTNSWTRSGVSLTRQSPEGGTRGDPVRKKPPKPRARGPAGAGRRAKPARAGAKAKPPTDRKRAAFAAAPASARTGGAPLPRHTPSDVPSASAAAEGRAKYVYCIVRSAKPRRFGRIGLGAEPTEVHTVSFREIGAAISGTPAEGVGATRENVLAHERVNETVMKS